MSTHDDLSLTESQLETLNKYNLTKDELNNLYQRRGAICAERSALCTSLNQQYRHFKALGIISDIANEIITPCGICRQFIREFGKEITLVMFQSNGQEFMIRTLEEILPFSFGPEQLK
ncbi:hypothetical protein WICPIJ_005769 [Wickerhamomyces pijperi]|uniref:CMP/dCMP-type deaminase domain-containing protein n=1 Tax=Wickerhamomyces pijperi TaxID=599730 RepID=A0A9P8TM08_WICPI|nr:hypothetical protein WICPIJ_005769 [Wickerhamomyces pijperi]